MAGLDDYADALRFNHFLNCLGNLSGEAFLDLQAARKEFDETRNFAQSDNPSVWNIGYMHLAEKRQHMVLAQAEHLDVFDDDHLVVADGEKSALEQPFGIFVVALSEELHRLLNARRSVDESLAAGIFAKTNQHLAN